MYRANQFITNFPVWTGLLAALWVLVGMNAYNSRRLPPIMIFQTKLKIVLAKLQLKERHLLEDIVIRRFGLHQGVLMWDTTFGLVYKTVAYLLVRSINGFLQLKSHS